MLKAKDMSRRQFVTSALTTAALSSLPASPVNGKAVSGAKPGEYLAVQRPWPPGDIIRLQMDVPVPVLEANPQVTDDTGRVAIQRGPVVYCMEEVDQPEGASISELAVNPGPKPETKFQSEFKSGSLGGVIVLHHAGAAYDRAASRKRSVFAIQQSSGPEPPGSTDVYSVLRLV
jgi:DUF1680 family protein